MNYPKLLQAIRAHFKLTQQQFAHVMGVGQAYISFLLKGKEKPSNDFKQRLILLMGYSLEELVGGAYLQHDYKWLLDRKTSFYLLYNQYMTAKANALLPSLDETNRVYLKNKLFVELDQLAKEIKQQQVNFEKHLTQLIIYQQELDCIQHTYTNTQANLTYLTQQQAPAELIQQQEKVVAAQHTIVKQFQDQTKQVEANKVAYLQLELRCLQELVEVKQKQFDNL